MRRSIASTTLTTPARPAAASRCPILVLTEPRPQRAGACEAVPARSRAQASRPWRSACTSIGSPSDVPVPCASMYETVAGSTPASRYAASISAACALMSGAVRNAARPP
ncbi:hypothetical protein Y023_4540 [Burkholderia pseudomallei A79D]|nr:hypothetical protein Y023_4540 [Burkholderia pseudomallei A79D]